MRDFEKKLYLEFPKFFDVSYEESPFKYRGFEIDLGWFELIKEMAQKIEAQAKFEKRTISKWPKCTQLKEKFGTLRCYVENGSPVIFAIIEEFESKSRLICYKCGKPGKLYTNGWHRVCCAKCEAKTNINQES